MSRGVGHVGNGNITCVYHVICDHVNMLTCGRSDGEEEVARKVWIT